MPTNIEFTDNNRMANTFVKEIYIGAKWAGLDSGDKMVLWQANNGTHQADYLIGIGLRSTFDPVEGVKDGFLISHNGSSGPIKMDTFGIFKGVDCYVVVDWVTPWTLPVILTDQMNGEIDFGAVVYMDLATDIDNSPTIKKYVYEQALANIASTPIPSYDFRRIRPTLPSVTSTTINVSTNTQLLNAIKNYNNVTINLQADIALSRDESGAGSLTTQRANGASLDTLININNKSLVIDGGSNKYKLYEYEDDDEIQTMLNENDGRYYANYSGSVTGKEAFMTENGTIIPLARSGMYKSRGWVHPANSNEFGLLLPPELELMCNEESGSSNVFVCYRLSYLRYTHRVTRLTQGVLFFEVTDSNDLTFEDDYRNRLTPNTDFYLINYVGANDGILIKNGQLSYPASFGVNKISPCWAEHLFRIKGNSHVAFNNVSFIGGTDHSVRNDNKLNFSQCHFTNIIAGCILNLRQMFVDQCEFTETLTNAIRFECLDGTYTPLPYMEVTNCIFRNIGHYGSNVYAIRNTGHAYIADNEFVDTNYGAIFTGQCNCDCELNLFSESLIERNYIHYSPEWIEKRKTMGLQDSGDIYISTNNKKAIVRFNRIVGTGGIEGTSSYRKNNAIYGDEGAYNMDIYCNVISDNENYYDIDCRDVSNNVTSTIPSNKHVNTCNNFLYNVCNGYVRIQENSQDEISNEEKCMFVDNFILQKIEEPEIQSSVPSGNIYNEVVYCKDSDGIMTDGTGIVAAATLVKVISDLVNVKYVDEE